MPRVLLSMPPTPGLRRVASAWGGDAGWIADGARGPADVLVSFWPRQELRHAGLGWQDLPGVRLVKLITAGANHVGWSTMPAGVPVAVTPGAMGPAIAEHVLAFVLSWARRIPASTQAIRDGRFDVRTQVRPLSSLRVGIVGYGGIGRAVARLLGPLGCRLAAVNRTGRGEDGGLEWLGTMEQLGTLAARSDVLVVAVPLVAKTQALVDAKVLARLPESALLVNVARGAVVRERDLYRWLEEDPRHWAGLDVWWQYPRDGLGHPCNEPFWRLPNVMMTPHDSARVPDMMERMLEAALLDVGAFLETGDLRHVQDPRDYEALTSAG